MCKNEEMRSEDNARFDRFDGWASGDDCSNPGCNCGCRELPTGPIVPFVPVVTVSPDVPF